MAYLALIRHGESEWNARGLWTGITDVGLTQKGREEARSAAENLKEIKFDVSFVSSLIRAKQTFEEMKPILNINNIEVIEDKALNERDYGIYTGQNKWQVQKEVGDEKFLKIRRGWDEPIPNGESLKDVYERVVPYYHNHVLQKLKEGKNVLVSAHGNSLRALVKYLENIPDQDIPYLEIPTGQLYLYQINNEGKITSKEIHGTS